MKTLPADLEALMPEPDGYAAMTPNGSIIVPPSRFREVNGYAIFTADQVREAMLAATERAAKVCDSMSGSDYSPAQCATAIRGSI